MGAGAAELVEASSERKNWNSIFTAMVQMLKSRQSQLETLVKERKVLEDRIRMQHDRWISDRRLYEEQISQLEGELAERQMERLLEASKFELVMALKQRKASLCQLQLEYTASEVEDFRALFDLLSPESSDVNSAKHAIEEGRNSRALEREVRRLREEYEKLASERSCEVSSLIAEKKFVWNQYNVMEKDFTNILRSKHSEVELANQKIEKLLASMAELKDSNNEKDEMIASLNDQVLKMESDSSKLKEEISRLSRELELLRKSSSATVTPMLKHCTSKSKTSGLGNKNSQRSRSILAVTKEISPAQSPNSVNGPRKGSRTSKRKALDGFSGSETPKLFSSDFKIPKLKIHIPA